MVFHVLNWIGGSPIEIILVQKWVSREYGGWCSTCHSCCKRFCFWQVNKLVWGLSLSLTHFLLINFALLGSSASICLADHNTQTGSWCYLAKAQNKRSTWNPTKQTTSLALYIVVNKRLFVVNNNELQNWIISLTFYMQITVVNVT